MMFLKCYLKNEYILATNVSFTLFAEVYVHLAYWKKNHDVLLSYTILKIGYIWIIYQK